MFRFLLEPVHSGDDITYGGDLPEGTTELWVRFRHGDILGNMRLTVGD